MFLGKTFYQNRIWWCFVCVKTLFWYLHGFYEVCLLCCSFWPLGDQFRSVGSGHAMTQIYSTYWHLITTMKIRGLDCASYLVCLDWCMPLVGNVAVSFFLTYVLNSDIGMLHHVYRNSFNVNLVAWPKILNHPVIVWMVSLNNGCVITFHNCTLTLWA